MDKPLAHGLLAALRYVQGLVPLAGGLAAWQIFGPVKSPYFPPPSAWFEGIMFLARSGKLRLALEATIISFLAAVVLACVIGFVVGVLIGRFRFLRRALTPLFEFCRGMPPPVLVPVVVLVLGYAESLKLLIIVWIAVWPILLNTASAAGLLDDLLIDVSRTFRLGAFTTLYKIVSPAVVPAFLTGVRIAIPLAIILTLLIEMLTSLPGIGSLIVTSQRQFRSAEVYGLLVLVGILGLAADLFFGALERAALRRWPPMVQNL